MRRVNPRPIDKSSGWRPVAGDAFLVESKFFAANGAMEHGVYFSLVAEHKVMAHLIHRCPFSASITTTLESYGLGLVNRLLHLCEHLRQSHLVFAQLLDRLG